MSIEIQIVCGGIRSIFCEWRPKNVHLWVYAYSAFRIFMKDWCVRAYDRCQSINRCRRKRNGERERNILSHEFSKQSIDFNGILPLLSSTQMSAVWTCIASLLMCMCVRLTVDRSARARETKPVDSWLSFEHWAQQRAAVVAVYGRV